VRVVVRFSHSADAPVNHICGS